jgi:hypothetical protein
MSKFVQIVKSNYRNEIREVPVVSLAATMANPLDIVNNIDFNKMSGSGRMFSCFVGPALCTGLGDVEV